MVFEFGSGFNPKIPPPEVSCHCDYGGLLKMAECLAARLTDQEQQIRLLTKEISTLRDGLSRGLDAAVVGELSPEVECLRTENEKLRYRLLHLRRGLQAELELEEEAQGKKQQGVKCGKAPEKNSGKEQRTKNEVVMKTEECIKKIIKKNSFKWRHL